MIFRGFVCIGAAPSSQVIHDDYRDFVALFLRLELWKVVEIPRLDILFKLQCPTNLNSHKFGWKVINCVIGLDRKYRDRLFVIAIVDNMVKVNTPQHNTLPLKY